MHQLLGDGALPVVDPGGGRLLSTDSIVTLTLLRLFLPYGYI